MQATELPVLNEDRQLDEDSSNTGEQCFEKLTAGLYMGDIARRIILRWVLVRTQPSQALLTFHDACQQMEATVPPSLTKAACLCLLPLAFLSVWLPPFMLSCNMLYIRFRRRELASMLLRHASS